jgi:hypothetical protein
MDQTLFSTGRIAGLLLTAPFGTSLFFILHSALTHNRNMFRPSPQDIAANEKLSRLGSVMSIIGLTCALLGLT